MGKFPRSRKEDLVVQKLKDEVLIFDLTINKAFCLNETSALVWELCDGNNSITQISQEIGKKLNSPANEDLVWMALDQLKKEKLVETGANSSPFEGINRREVIKKVGLATMIALPIVASVLAPTAVLALSCVPNGGKSGCAVLAGPAPGTPSCGVSTANCCNGGVGSGSVLLGGSDPSCPVTNLQCVCQ